MKSLHKIDFFIGKRLATVFRCNLGSDKIIPILLLQAGSNSFPRCKSGGVGNYQASASLVTSPPLPLQELLFIQTLIKSYRITGAPPLWSVLLLTHSHVLFSYNPCLTAVFLLFCRYFLIQSTFLGFSTNRWRFCLYALILHKMSRLPYSSALCMPEKIQVKNELLWLRRVKK